MPFLRARRYAQGRKVSSGDSAPGANARRYAPNNGNNNMITNNHEYNQVKDKLLGAGNILAPTGAVQRRLVNLVHDMEDAHEVPQEVIRALLSTLLDGVQHGNWPAAEAKPIVRPALPQAGAPARVVVEVKPALPPNR